MRAFFAAFPKSDDLHRIESLTREVGAARPSRGIRWVPVENCHVTLRFMGTIDTAEVSALAELTRDVLAQRRPLACTATAMALWPSGRRPRVLVLTLDSDGHLEALAERLNTALMGAGFGGPDKPFRAHLTLARLARAKIQLPDEPMSLALEFSRIGLFESVTRPEGAVYRQVFASRAHGGTVR